MATLEILSQLGKKEREFVRWTIFNKNTLKHARTWASAIRKLDHYTILPFWRAYDLRSDIAGNHAVLFGIKHSAIQSDGILPSIKKLEVRIDQTIRLGDMTHLEVPLENVEETRRRLTTKHITLPVIPLEYGELYCSQFPLTQLAHV